MVSPARPETLESRIQQAREAYYNDRPIMSDEQFDALVDELESSNPESPAITSVGAPPPKNSIWPKREHSIPMGSLSKVQTVDEMTSWVNGNSRSLHDRMIPFEELLITEKLDGISISVTYERGVLVEAVTRGDGLVGEVITPNVAKMKGVLRSVEYDEPFTLRGEIMLHKEDLAEYFPDKANARNAASGTAKRLDGKGCQHLTVYFYQVHGPDMEKDSDQFIWLERYGFLYPQWYVTVMAPGAKTPQDIWVEYQQKIRDELPYEIDGLVVRLNDMDHQHSLGELHGRPKGAVAFKFAPVTRDTRAVGLAYQVGGQGHITPVAEVAPVNLLGAEVRRASLYNWAYIRQIGFHVGAKVTITRANDVIPRIVSVSSPTQEPEAPPETCPVCGEATVWEGEYLTCPNTAGCPAQVEGRLRRWCQELGILEWGDVLIGKVVKAGLATTVPGLYRLVPADLAALDRMGPTSGENAVDQLWSVLPLPLEQLIGALGIPLCATSTLEIIVGAGYDTLEALECATEEQLREIPGVGPKRARALVNWLENNQTFLMEMFDAGITIEPPSRGALTGKSFCFSGKMVTKRPVLEGRVKKAGGQVKKSVSKGLSYLVLSNPDSTSAKAKAARKQGTEIISEEAFLEMVG